MAIRDYTRHPLTVVGNDGLRPSLRPAPPTPTGHPHGEHPSRLTVGSAQGHGRSSARNRRAMIAAPPLFVRAPRPHVVLAWPGGPLGAGGSVQATAPPAARSAGRPPPCPIHGTASPIGAQRPAAPGPVDYLVERPDAGSSSWRPLRQTQAAHIASTTCLDVPGVGPVGVGGYQLLHTWTAMTPRPPPTWCARRLDTSRAKWRRRAPTMPCRGPCRCPGLGLPESGVASAGFERRAGWGSWPTTHPPREPSASSLWDTATTDGRLHDLGCETRTTSATLTSPIVTAFVSTTPRRPSREVSIATGASSR